MDHSPVTWRKSRRSEAGGNACVEVATRPGQALIRDSKNPDGHRHVISRTSFAGLVTRIKRGELDL